MRKSIPSRVCDRCGEAYELYAKGPRKAHALKVSLATVGKEGWAAGFPDLCPKCSHRTQVIVANLVMTREFDGKTPEEIIALLRR
ncbi:MAG: hypothetical protein GYA36_19060 [Veillonellaceae bacterium]|nr:hypothetical protein [Veillonellaceae bacterium]